MTFGDISLFSRALTLMKARLKGAQKGHSLLKKKSDALTMRFRKILKQIIEVSALWRVRGRHHEMLNISFELYFLFFHPQTKTLMGDVMREATFSLAEANFAAGDFR